MNNFHEKHTTIGIEAWLQSRFFM